MLTARGGPNCSKSWRIRVLRNPKNIPGFVMLVSFSYHSSPYSNIATEIFKSSAHGLICTVSQEEILCIYDRSIINGKERMSCN